MGKKAEHNWDALYDVWKQRKANETLVQFCEKFNLKYDNTKKAFSRVEEKKGQIEGQKRDNEKIGQKNPEFKSEEKEENSLSIKIEQVKIDHDNIYSRAMASLISAMERVERVQLIEIAVDNTIKTTKEVKEVYSSMNDLVKALRDILPFIMELKNKAMIEEIRTRAIRT
ncbi:MAG: hypothetical protein HQK78_17935 [Desulfobacterales bacterium]|nr:hypothetical protein [Desulfobacterales bacterium]